jgi:hypothetical protein
MQPLDDDLGVHRLEQQRRVADRDLDRDINWLKLSGIVRSNQPCCNLSTSAFDAYGSMEAASL